MSIIIKEEDCQLKKGEEGKPNEFTWRIDNNNPGILERYSLKWETGNFASVSFNEAPNGFETNDSGAKTKEIEAALRNYVLEKYPELI